MQKQRISSGTDWETLVGYSRVIRAGQTIEVSGTVAVDGNGRIVGQGDPYEQARYILSKIDRSLKKVGASLKDVIRTRMYVTDITRWEEVGRAHGECFGDIRPATSMVEVQALIDPACLVEIEVTAILEVTEKND